MTDGSLTPISQASVDLLEESFSYNTTGSDVHQVPNETTSLHIEDQNGVHRTSLMTAQSSNSSPSSDTFIIRRSNDIPPGKLANYITSMFVALIPYGTGGPNEKRRRPMSFVSWVQRVLRLAGHRFSRHWAFSLVAFDIIALRKRIVKCTTV